MHKAILSLLVSIITITSYAQGPGADRGFSSDDMEGRKPGQKEQRGGGSFDRALGMLENRPEVAERLGITENQINELKQSRNALQKQLRPLQRELMEARKNLRELMEGESPDEASIMRAIEQNGRLQTDVHKLRVKMMLQIRGILGDDVYKRIQHQKRKPAGDRQEMRNRMRQNRNQFQQGDNTGGRTFKRAPRNRPADSPDSGGFGEFDAPADGTGQ